MPNAPFLAPERDSAFKRGRFFGSAAIQPSIPGVPIVSVGSTTISANTDYYAPFFVETPIRLSTLTFEVSSGVAGNARVGIYAADTDLQPTGAPLADSGNIDVTAAAIKTYTPGTPILLPRGRYLEVLNSSVGPGLRLFRGAYPGNPGVVGDYTVIQSTLSVSRTYAAFPTPGTAWTPSVGGSTPLNYFVWMTVTSA